MSKKIKFTFNPDGWNIKIQYRSKDRMKFQLKLNKEEAEAFKNFWFNTWRKTKRTMKPQGLPSMPLGSSQVLLTSLKSVT